MVRQTHSRKAYNMSGRDCRAVAGCKAAARDTRDDRNARRAHSNLRARAAEIRRKYAGGPDQFRDRGQSVMRVLWKFAKPADRRNAQHARKHAGKLHRPALIPPSRNAGNAPEPGFDYFLGDKLRDLIAADAKMDDIDLTLDTLIQGFDQIAEMAARR